jgi:hypothetical protein
MIFPSVTERQWDVKAKREGVREGSRTIFSFVRPAFFDLVGYEVFLEGRVEFGLEEGKEEVEEEYCVGIFRLGSRREEVGMKA